MFKWVTPQMRLPMRSHIFLATIQQQQQQPQQKQQQPQQPYRQPRRRQRQLLSFGLTTLIIIGALFVQTTSGFRSIETNGAGRKLFGGYRITPKHCRATKTLPSTDPRANGPTICMFNHECAQRGGEVVGACMDGFLFGACCQVSQMQDELASTLINEAQNAYFQQHQQQQQKLPQTVAAAQSYENYGEQQQQLSDSLSQEKDSYPTSPQQNIYDQQNMNKLYQQLGSSSTTSSGYGDSQTQSQSQVQSHAQAQSQSHSQVQSQQTHHEATESAAVSASVEFEQEAQLHTDNQLSHNNEVDKNQAPSSFHVHKHSVKISSPSSPPQNDDFVMQVLSTLPPEHEGEHPITFTTEVPTKIASSIVEQTSSESSSFEEEPPATKAPAKQEQPQLVETIKRPVQQAKPKPAEHTNLHHHNHLLLDGGEFTHSDITHPGADADLVEDLQFSTGYGPQPAYAEPPKQQTTVQADDKYVLVQTIPSEKRPNNAATTSPPITTHVDSIESIILQLNNTSHGPSYNVVSQSAQAQTPSYGQAAVIQAVAHDSYGEPSTTARPYDTNNYNEESETKRPENYYNSETDNAQDSSYTTSANYNADSEIVYDKVSDEKDTSAYEQHTQRPGYGEDASAVMDEQTVPASSYNDIVSVTSPQTSQFNKMPAMGVAYPVDMSYTEEESNEPSAYGPLASSSESALTSSTETSYQKISNTYNEQSQAQPSPAYVRPTSNANKPNRPVASYIGMVTMQNYNKQPAADYSQVPPEVSVSSHTTKVQGDYAEETPAYQQTAAKLPATTPVPVYISSTSAPLAQRPQYDSLVVDADSSSVRPLLVTAGPKPRPRPNQKRPSSSSGSIKKKPQQSTVSYNPASQSLADYTPTESYTRRPVTQPASNYNVEVATLSNIKQPSGSYNNEQDVQPALSYNQEVASSPTRRPGTHKPPSKKPVSTSYVTGPSTPRPPATVDYHFDKVPPLYMADDKLDAFIQSTAENIVGSTPAHYQPPLFATTATPVHNRPTNSYGSQHKKPGFVQVQNGTPKPPVPTVLITPKPTAINLVTASSWAQTSNTKLAERVTTTPSYVYKRPTDAGSTPSYAPVQPVSSNDFEDPGYFGMQSNVHSAFTQSTTEAVFAVPSNDKPAFPGYYGPTPTYPAFSVPGEKVGEHIEEETYTSPNDFNNFPPVRNPNLNMSAVSSAVTSDLELSTPSFVEDVVLKDKMNTLVHKLVASLQGNFEALADMIDEPNNTAATYQAGAAGGATTVTRKPTRKPVRVASTTKPKATTRKPVTRVSTKAPNKKTSVTTRKPATRRTTVVPSTTTRKPSSKKPTRRVSTTSTTISAARPVDDEIVDEEDEEDLNPNPQENEIDQGSTLSSYGGANGRKIQCGVRPHVKSGRIVGGKGSTFGAFPWQVLVRESTWLGLFTKNKCGGVLITNRYVITAAHCQPGFLASLVAVMGEFDISGDLESKRPTTKNVKRVIVHRQYDPATFENDLALLELDSSVQFDTHIVPICMPNDLADFTGRMATVTGWGRLKYGGGVPSVLQEVQVPVIENSVCQEMFHTAGHNKKILNSFLCAGYANGQKDSCEGDSGGPLVLQRPDGRYELAGTVSHGIKCAAPYLPGVYMRTTFYKPWLRSITGVK